MDVEKGEDILVLVDDVAGDFSARDPAEQAVVGHSGLQPTIRPAGLQVGRTL
jgi:hypothetical protein